MRWSRATQLVTMLMLTTTTGGAQSGARALQPAPTGSPISVSPNIQVSRQFPKLAHYETSAADDPAHPGRLIACSIVQHEDRAARSVHCYASFDNGKSWPHVLELDANIAPHIGQPAAAYGRGDTAFVVTTVAPFRRGEIHIPSSADVPFPTLNEWGVEGMKRTIGVFRSIDAGKTWDRVSSFEFIDGPTIAVDKTAGRFAGRVYVGGSLAVSGYSDGASSVRLYRSTDGGRTFLGPAQRTPAEGGSFSAQSNSVMLSDGTLAFLVTHGKPRLDAGSANAQPQIGGGPIASARLQLLTSTDGGESLNPEVTVSEWVTGRGGGKSLAVDRGSRFFKDRLYAVWADAATGRSVIRFAYSADKGRTWSAPVTVSDDRTPAEPNSGPDHSNPSVGVNADGVVLVAWYDRREIADGMGWRVWAAASLDGGVTFTPNRPVSEAPNAYTSQTEWIVGGPNVAGGGTRKPGIEQGRPVTVAPKGRPLSVALDLGSFFVTGGGNLGMAVGSDGAFRPMWVDNRTGIGQLWTSAISVSGAVEKHGARELADLTDVTDRVTLEAESTDYDRSTNTLTLVARLKNTSKDIVRTPLKVRVTSLSSLLGVPSIVGAENGVAGVGAIWDFGATIPAAGLQPEATGAPRTLTFRLTDLRPIRLLRESPGFTSRLVTFEARVFGLAASAERAAP